MLSYARGNIPKHFQHFEEKKKKKQTDRQRNKQNGHLLFQRSSKAVNVNRTAQNGDETHTNGNRTSPRLEEKKQTKKKKERSDLPRANRKIHRYGPIFFPLKGPLYKTLIKTLSSVLVFPVAFVPVTV